jgi:hypothetical protein
MHDPVDAQCFAVRGARPTLFVLTHRIADQPPEDTGFRFVDDLDVALARRPRRPGTAMSPWVVEPT